LKNIIKYILYRRRYPKAQVNFRATVAGKTELGSKVIIRPGAYVFQSRLGDNVEIFEGCRLFEVNAEGNNIVYDRCTLSGAQLGAYSYLGQDAHAALIDIGRFCSIGPAFKCGFGSHPTNYVSTSPVFYSTRKQCGVSFAERDDFTEYHQTVVGHDVWIGANVYIKDGVSVGDGAIVAAGAVVSSNVAPYAIVGGVPAKCIRLRFDEAIVEKLLEIKWWNWSETDLRAAQSLFAKEGAEAFLEWHKQKA